MSKGVWKNPTSKYYPVRYHPLFKVWCGMKARCYNPNAQKYKNYGGRGIKVCDRWRNSFDNFVDDMGERPSGMSIDRIDNDGNYEPSNCKWSTAKQQARNRRPKTKLNGYIGVSSRKYKDNTYYHASIWFENQNIHISSTSDSIEAAKDYDFVARQLYGDSANLNFR